jgi:hypothetical protein
MLGAFIKDLARFQANGRAKEAYWNLAARSDVLFLLLLDLGAVYLCYRMSNAVMWFLLPLFIGITAYSVFVQFMVRVLTPLHFGRTIEVRLDGLDFWGKPGVFSVAQLLLMDSGTHLSARIEFFRPIKHTVGRTYLALRHPDRADVILPLLDDDSDFLSYLLSFVQSAHRDEVLRDIAALRIRTEAAPQPNAQ